MICFAAHPDDETIGAGGQLSRWPAVRIVHATDGAPRNMEDARRYGFLSRAAYARARREEVIAALRLAGIPPARSVCLEFSDQECCRRLVELTRAIFSLLIREEPRSVLAPLMRAAIPTTIH